ATCASATRRSWSANPRPRASVRRKSMRWPRASWRQSSSILPIGVPEIPMNDLVKNLLLWAMVAVVLMLVSNSFNPGTGATSEVRYSQFMEQVRRDQIKSVKIAEDEKSIEFVTKGGESGTVIAPRRDEGMMDDLINHKVEIQAAPPSSGPSFIYILI